MGACVEAKGRAALVAAGPENQDISGAESFLKKFSDGGNRLIAQPCVFSRLPQVAGFNAMEWSKRTLPR